MVCPWWPEFPLLQGWNKKQTNKNYTKQYESFLFFFFNHPLIKFKSLMRNTTTKLLVSLIHQICFSPIFIKRANPYWDRWREEPWWLWWCVWIRDLWKYWEPPFVNILYTEVNLLRSIICLSISKYTFPLPPKSQKLVNWKEDWGLFSYIPKSLTDYAGTLRACFLTAYPSYTCLCVCCLPTPQYSFFWTVFDI